MTLVLQKILRQNEKSKTEKIICNTHVIKSIWSLKRRRGLGEDATWKQRESFLSRAFTLQSVLVAPLQLSWATGLIGRLLEN